jgi:hypothetical protein
MAVRKPLWRCPNCGERFVTRNMAHSCGRFPIENLFARSEPHVFRLYKKLARMIRKCGPVHIIPQKTRLVFQVRVRFAGITVRKSDFSLGLWFTRRYDHPRVERIEIITPRCYLHKFRIASESDLDVELQRWLRRAYLVGQQKHLDREDL